ncbi:putative nucleotidyltransferase [Paenibacillus shirakamiensis]|uniref:Nucleotidyltransferase n=1 Tax=Paenibacillus shirakamiensis TaxID=1265935 RepID=A0ABS4JHG8_9BACL|nr:putative nucleotidyltransferase [Paenibacillus shirakamiensis]
MQPAEWFAYGAVSLLQATGLVTHLVFGSEEGDTSKLHELAALLATESSELTRQVAEHLATGVSYPAAYAAAAASLLRGASADGARELLQQPNNALGLHYLIALRRLGSAIQPLTIRREAAGYHDAQPGAGRIASATAVRRLLLESGLAAASPYLPDYTASILAREMEAGRAPITWDTLRQPLFHELLVQSPAKLAQLLEVTEGLEHRIAKVLPILPELSVNHLLQALKTKRYTHTKLQRMLVHILLQHPRELFTREKLAQGPAYIRVLGFTSKGQQLLKRMKKTASLPILTKPSDLDDVYLTLDIQAAAVYANANSLGQAIEAFRDYRQPPIRI